MRHEERVVRSTNQQGKPVADIWSTGSGKNEKKRRAVKIAVAGGFALATAFVIVFFAVIRPAAAYDRAWEAFSAGKYSEAADAFAALGNYGDAAEKEKLSRYFYAGEAFEQGKYDEAAEAYAALGDFMDAGDAENESRYILANEAFAAGEYAKAAVLYGALGEYLDAEQLAKESNYLLAESYMDAGEYDEAYAALSKISGYRDVDRLMGTVVSLTDAADTAYAVGNTVSLGSYAGYVLDWIVLEEDGNERVLISKYGVEAKPYHFYRVKTDWENCTLRAWLNDEFYQAAFSEREKEMICLTRVANNDNAFYHSEGGNDTDDYVYLLSYEEAEKYFAGREERLCYASPRAVSSVAWTNPETGTGWWWLRSSGVTELHAARVLNNGETDNYGYVVSNANGCVRPVIRISLK